jgi:hypothetical protein
MPVYVSKQMQNIYPGENVIPRTNSKKYEIVK